jgi:fluoride exporter
VVFSVLAISLGAALGALLRWMLGTRLNAVFPFIPPGTLAANLIGGYLIGVAVAFFATHPELPPQWRLFAVTGFLGGLTTFSTFSAEVVDQLMQGRLTWALSAVAIHVGGSLAMTLLGIASVAAYRAALRGA